MVRSESDLNEAQQANINEIQKNLNYRRSGLLMMNTNYSNHTVRKVEAIYVNEARTLVTHY